jgi:hypothetical protein
MNTRNRVTKSLPLVALASSVVVIGAVWPAARVAAIGNPDIRSIEFGLLSLAPGQTARLKVVNPVLQAPPDPDTAARRVRLAFDIYAIGDVENRASPDGTASRLSSLRLIGRQSRVVVLQSGVAASFEFTAGAAETPISAAMIDVDGSGTPNPDGTQDTRGSHIVPTLEVMEGGRTVFTFSPSVYKGFQYGGGG